MDKNSTVKIGDILIDKGIITREQLDIAIRKQKEMRKALEGFTPTASQIEATQLGEVLIGLGFITRLQLKRSLNWQRILRKMTLAMTLCAPLMTLGSGAAAQITPTNNKTSYSLPLQIEAENYTAMYGIQTEKTSDTGGGLNVGWVHANDWMSYSDTVINAPISGNYKVVFRLASAGAGGSFAFHSADGSKQYGVVEVPNTGGSQKWVDVEKTIYLPAGEHAFGITIVNRGVGFNINWFKLDVKGLPLPTKIEAESYDTMYGVQTEKTSDTGGGLNVGWLHDADWMTYANTLVDIPATGTYKITYRVASTSGGGSFAFQEADGSTQYDLVPVPATGGSQKWVDVTRQVQLPAGTHKFGINILARGSGFNINWFKVETLDGSSTAALPSNTTTNSSSSSSTANISSSSSSAPAIISSSASSVPSSSSSSAPSNTQTSSSTSSSSVQGQAIFRWEVPVYRENGDYLDVTELGGYELRYRKVGDADYTYISIEDPWQVQYSLNNLEGNYEFQIAAFDKNGLYSNFVTLKPL